LPNHGEAEAAESHDDFVHKLKVCLKDGASRSRWIRLVRRSQLLPENDIVPLETESDELIRIFVASIRTSRQRALKRSQARASD
jgi:four helix bundle protein